MEGNKAMDMNDRVEAVRKELGMSGAEFASKLDMTPSMYSKIKNKVYEPSKRVILEICRQFGIDKTWLETGEGEMHTQKNLPTDRLTEEIMRVFQDKCAFSEMIRISIEMYYEMQDDRKKTVNEMFEEYRKRLLFK